MKEIFKYVKEFKFKDMLAVFLIYKLLDLLAQNPSLRDILIVLITLIVKHYYDSNTGAVKRDETISKALDRAQGSAPVIENSEVTNVKK